MKENQEDNKKNSEELAISAVQNIYLSDTGTDRQKSTENTKRASQQLYQNTTVYQGTIHQVRAETWQSTPLVCRGES